MKALRIQFRIESIREVLEGSMREISVNNGLINTLRSTEYLKAAQPVLHA